ncbi:RND family efflux transporter MFP subunit [Inhella inkyongensis]|uniref:RND family efflux transporter MFP subunit n=1 Tax=Inhella inkyongensis TaxID=392593 RepID=A0A840RYF5_9BURK|nr:HlyD family efflux transporter periplasmic adaptor subunit [Inhella inkyongensis]MBB5202985.1 RND family efflux transporter MFP subunit [Inhella inkyongensis]
MRALLMSLCLASASVCFNAAAGPGAHGPNGEHLDAPSGSATAGGLGRLPDGSLNVPKSAQRRLGVRTLMAPESEAAASLELPGRVIAHPNASGQVQSVHGGRVEAGPKGLPLPGQPVKKGEVLAYVKHHADPYAVGAQQAQLAELRAQRELATQRLRRLEELAGSVPRKEIDAARSEAQALTERERLIATSLNQREVLLAPLSGVVARNHVAVGQVVEAGGLLMEIVDPGRLLIEATHTDPSLAARIAGAQLVLANAGGAGIDLKLIGAARALRDGVLPLSFALQTQDAGLALGQPVSVLVRLNESAKGIVLPAESLVRSANGEAVVWIKTGAERFLPQPVQARALDARTVLVTQGLAADNRVVVQGAALLNQIR